MEPNPVVGQQREVAGNDPQLSTQAGRMRAAIRQAVAAGPGFLRGEIDAGQMAATMIGAVQHYAEQERVAGGDGWPRDAQTRALQEVLSELLGCGSGYLAGRCDAACVGRTMADLVREFGT